MLDKFRKEIKAHQSFNAKVSASLDDLGFECAAIRMVAPSTDEAEDMQDESLMNHYARMNASAERHGVERGKMSIAGLVASAWRGKSE